MALDPVAQQLDFSLGAFQSGALEREPQGAAEAIVGFIGDDGLPRKRGGASWKSTAAGGSAVLWVADAQVLAGRRTLFGTSAGLFTLDTDDVTPLQLTTGSPLAYTEPVEVNLLDGAFYVEPGSTGKSVVWGGSRKAAYSTGTVTVAVGDRVVTGVGTSWSANVEPGMFFGSNSALIDSVQSNTQLTLRQPWKGGALSGSAYTISPLYVLSLSNPQPVYEGVTAQRILRTNGSNRMDFSQINNNGAFDADDHHLFPSGILGFGSLRDVALVFTTTGVWAVSNLAYGLADVATGDPQQRRELVNADLILWGRLGIASWSGLLVVPALDGVYLVDSLGAPTRISDRIQDLYLSYVAAGYKPGGAEVYQGEYHLPILNGNAWVDTLVCRLEATHSDVRYGWSQLAGHGAKVTGFAERPGVLLGASTQSPRLLDCSAYRLPAAGVKNDADGSAVGFSLTTIDYPTGGMVSNFVHSVRLKYAITTVDAATLAAEVSIDGGSWSALTSAAGASATEATWRVNRHAKNVRFRFSSSLAAADVTVKSVEVFVRHSGRR